MSRDKKIALCFLKYGNLSQSNIWKNFINSKYNIYIHNKYNFIGEFNKYCIGNKIKTKWGYISLVKATLNLFKDAFKNEDNEYFILLSDKCIPLYNPDTIYNKVKELDNNLISNYNQHRNRYDKLHDKTFFNKNEFMKQQQWMLLKRNTVKFFIENDYTHIFGNDFVFCDEHYFTNIISKFNIPFINRLVTYVNWSEKSDLEKYRPFPKTYSKLTNDIIENILKSDYLFMRKIGPECVLPSYFDKIKPLKFIHITKTGGTSIENVGKQNNILWGMYHKEYRWWHEPFKNKPEYLKRKYNWFTVVRNPYTRIVSEFYCKWGTKIKNDKKSINKLEFNQIIKHHIVNRNNLNRKIGQYGHYKEQYLYLDKKYNIHILKFENLSYDFDNLMKKYSLNIKLDIHDNKNNKIHTVSSLSPEVIKIINSVYDKDFKMFGYKKLLANN